MKIAHKLLRKITGAGCLTAVWVVSASLVFFTPPFLPHAKLSPARNATPAWTRPAGTTGVRRHGLMARAAAQRRIYAGDGPPERPGRGVLLRRQGEIPPAKPSARLALTTTSPRPGLQPLGLGPSLSACASGCQSVSVDVSAGSQWPLQRPPPATEHPPRPDVALSLLSRRAGSPTAGH